MEKVNIAIAMDTPEARNALLNAANGHGLEVVLVQAPGMSSQEFIEQVGHLRPELVFIETSRLWGPLQRVIESLRSTGGSPGVVLIHPGPDPEAILDAVRAGAAEFIYPPFDVNTIRSIERLLRDRGTHRRAVPGKTLGFVGVKGGCGATTIACHVAAELKRSCGKSVLLADFDADLGLIDFLLKTKPEYTVADALQNAQRLDHNMWQAFAATGPCDISVLSAPDEPGKLSLDRDQSARFFDFVRSEYDYTVVDLGRGVTRLNFAAMTDIDITCLVTTMDIPALHRARKMIRTLLNNGCSGERLRLIVNWLPKRHDVSISELEKMIEFPVFMTVSEDIQATWASHSQNGLVSPGTALGKQIVSMAYKLTGQPEKEKETRRFRLFASA